MLNRICELCGKEHDGSYGSGRFCSEGCSRRFSTRNFDSKKTKICGCIVCGKEVEINRLTSSSVAKCDSCKQAAKLEKKKCKICGQSICKRPDICRKRQIFPALIKYYGFDNTKLGTMEAYAEFERIKTIVVEEYLNTGLSITDIQNSHQMKSNNTTRCIFKAFGIKSRTISEGVKTSIQQGKGAITSSDFEYQYKTGWHITWNNKRVFYRSSYELEYAKELDEKKIDYEMEKLRFLYWDSQKLMQRTAIPDFYLPETNTIVEIKSSWTYDEQNMKDKAKAYCAHGYLLDVILDFEKIEIVI